jgi:hypothetical protein
MSRMNRICKRCHRVRTVNGAGYCAGCADTLRDMEKPHRRPRVEGEEELEEATTDPAPAELEASAGIEEHDDSPDTPRSESIASEPPASGVKT